MNKSTCAICLEKFRRPKLLPCHHTFCQTCIQGVAGSSPSFPCPSCRTLVLLPPEGVGALQTSFHIEKDMASTPLSGKRQLCDVCTQDREATLKCLQCQQKFCAPCSKYHDAFNLSSRHSVVSLQDVGDFEVEVGQSEDPKAAQMCSKHPGQHLALYCKLCDLEICNVCELTNHLGHPTDNLADVRVAVDAKLQIMLENVTDRLKRVDQLSAAFTGRRDKLRQQQKSTEQELKGRADTLHQWTKQALNDVVESTQLMTTEWDKKLEDSLEQLTNQRQSLQALHNHVIRVFKDKKVTDVASLEVQLSLHVSDDAGVEEMEKEVSKDLPTLSVKHSIAAKSQTQLRSFVGVLETSQQPFVPPEHVDSLQPEASQEKAEQSPSSSAAEGSFFQQVLGRAISFIKNWGGQVLSSFGAGAAAGPIEAAAKKPAESFVYSKNPSSSVLAMCPIIKSRVWIKFQPDQNSSPQLKLLDVEQNSLTKANCADCDGLCYFDHDTVLAWDSKYSLHTVYTIKSDGSVTKYKTDFTPRWIRSCASHETHYGRKLIDWNFSRMEFVFVNDTTPNSGRPRRRTSKRESPNALNSSIQMKHSVIETIFDDQSPFLYDTQPRISAGGYYFVHVDLKEEVDENHEFYLKQFRFPNFPLTVYSTAGGRLAPVSTYPTVDPALDVCFCQLDGEELMLVLVSNDDRVHVVDHTDGCRFVRYLDTSPQVLDHPGCLASDFYQHVWIGCGGGKVVMVHL